VCQLELCICGIRPMGCSLPTPAIHCSVVDDEFVYCSQMAARGVYRTLQSAEDICDAQRVLGVIVKIADDPGNVQCSVAGRK